MIYPIILCGGSGTRLWPLSRKSFPKQFAKIIGEKSLFQESALRLKGSEFALPFVVTGEDFRFTVIEQLANVSLQALSVLVEPSGKNTAPAIAAAALAIKKQDENGLMLIMPSDHVITNANAFKSTVLNAKNNAINGEIVTFGIKPTSPETGYGYLHLEAHEKSLQQPIKLKRFVEKPNLVQANLMLDSGEYLWNAGIFMFSVKTIIDAFEKFAPQMLREVEQAYLNSKSDLGFIRLDEQNWNKIHGESIDYAIMERADNIVAMPYNEGWSDLGGWSAVWSELEPDENGVVCSEGATAIDCKDTLLRSESDNLEIVGIGLDDIVAIAMPDAVVIAKKSESQKIKDAVSILSEKGARQATSFPKDYRPWGWYESLVIGKSFQVKRIVVKPGASLSLQSHFHRAEHWIVVEGTASVTIGAEVKLVSENQSVYIPIGEKHRLENPGKMPVVLIEVQTGNYLGEDDIIRYQDIYDRNI
jgi:mannose-1-phosphate guanylyltransferase / mannose-6-phosphate isomerase